MKTINAEIIDALNAAALEPQAPPALEAAHVRILQETLRERINRVASCLASTERSIMFRKRHAAEWPDRKAHAKGLAHLETEQTETLYKLKLLRESQRYFDSL
jgi:hypothetical protein